MNESAEPALPGNDSNALMETLDAALERLRPHDRELILLRFFEGRTFPQIAEHEGGSADAARLKVDRALDRLRHHLERLGIASTAAALSTAMARAGSDITLSSESAQSLIRLAAVMGRAGGTSMTPVAVSKIVAWTVVPVAAAACIMAAYWTSEASRLRTSVRSEMGSPATAAKEFATSAATPAMSVDAASVSPPTQGISPEETRVLYDRLQKLLHTDPLLLRLKLEQSEANARGRYAALFASLGLDEHEREAFIRLQSDKTHAGLRLAAARFERGLAETDASFLALLDRHRRTELEPIERARSELLGPAFGGFEAFEASLSTAPLADSLAGALHYSDTPLSAGQAVAFMAVALEANSTRAPRPDWNALDSDVLQEKARAILSAPQISALERLLAQAKRQTAIDRRTDEIMREVARQGAR